MCMTLEALVAFLNLLPADRVETSPDEIIIHADAGPAIWTEVGPSDRWCTDAPQDQAANRSGDDI